MQSTMTTNHAFRYHEFQTAIGTLHRELNVSKTASFNHLKHSYKWCVLSFIPLGPLSTAHLARARPSGVVPTT